ncbi:hypothetical protein EDM56_30775 [Brevibacillus fluminis]|uniref:Uncharacterized protein n=1 Tax=Brevibacillus fluminis TaxID=511487 RepID=A0A3M8CQD6_9BACL|nr:hypothetical protein EDM56_30775 [Brevibacillus fluminis]
MRFCRDFMLNGESDSVRIQNQPTEKMQVLAQIVFGTKFAKKTRVQTKKEREQTGGLHAGNKILNNIYF